MADPRSIAFVTDKLSGHLRRGRSATAFAELIVEGLIPEGRVLVPGNPTPPMWNAGIKAFQALIPTHAGKVVGAIWSAMLSASPDLPGFDRRNQDG